MTENNNDINVIKNYKWKFWQALAAQSVEKKDIKKMVAEWEWQKRSKQLTQDHFRDKCLCSHKIDHHHFFKNIHNSNIIVVGYDCTEKFFLAAHEKILTENKKIKTSIKQLEQVIKITCTKCYHRKYYNSCVCSSLSDKDIYILANRRAWLQESYDKNSLWGNGLRLYKLMMDIKEKHKNYKDSVKKLDDLRETLIPNF